MNLRSVFIIGMAVGAFVWTGCEPYEKKRGRTNQGSSNTSPGMTKVRNMPKDQLYRIQIEDFICNAQNINMPGKNSQTVAQIARGLTDKFENYIVNSGCFQVVASRTTGDRDAAIREVDETSSDYYDQDTAVEFGKQRGAQLQMRGMLVALNIIGGGDIAGGNEHFLVGVSSTTYEVRLSCKVFDNATGVIAFAGEGIGEIDDNSLIAGGGDQNWFVGGKIADNTPLQEAVDAAVDALVVDLVEKAYR